MSKIYIILSFLGIFFFIPILNTQADALTLLQSTDSPTHGTTIAPTLDLTNNLYTIRLTGATWNPLTAFEYVGVTKSNGNYFGFRTESSKLTLYSVRNYVTYFSQANLLNLVSGTKYDFEMDVGLKHIRLFADDVQILNAHPYRVNGAGGTVTTEVFDPINPNLAWIGPHTAVDNISVYQRDMSLMTNLVLLGDSITLATAFESRLSSQLSRDWFISNHSRGYRQSRELRNAILTSSPGDRYFPGTLFYPDVTGFYRSDMASNKILIGVGTNDLLWSNNASGIGKGTPDGANTYGPEEGGYVAVDAQDGNDHNTINNILDAIDDIVSDNPGWKVYYRTPLNTNGYITAGYSAGETKRQAIRTSALSGLIKEKIEATGGAVIDQDNVFAPVASRTDGSSVDGSAYNPTYWPPSVQASGYSNNSTYFDSYHIHPTTAGYNAIADYVATILSDETSPVISDTASSTSQTTATVTWTTDESSDSKVSYGTSSGVYTTSTSSASFVTSHSLDISSLTESTLYYFVVVSKDVAGNTATSSEYTFLTASAPDTTPPEISIPNISDITSSSVTISWDTDENASSTVAYGLTSDYGSTTSLQADNTSFSFSITGLSESTTYHYQASSTDQYGNLATSTDATFTTISSDSDPPTRSGGSPSGTLSDGTTEVTLSLTTDESATCKYGTTASTAYASIVSTFSTTGGTTHSQSITGLTNGTSYNYYVRCVDGLSNANTDDYIISFSVASPASNNNSGGSSGGSSSRRTTAPTTFNETQARTTLLDLINQLKLLLTNQGKTLPSNIQAIEQALLNNTPSSPTPNTIFTRNLTVNDTGPDVKQLQIFLNTHGFIIAPSGPGSSGKETERFGYATRNALTSFQKANNITPALGYFGPKTREVVNNLIK